MRVLVVGDRGYIGAVMVPVLRAAGHEVDGLDLGLYEGCDLGPALPEAPLQSAGQLDEMLHRHPGTESDDQLQYRAAGSAPGLADGGSG